MSSWFWSSFIASAIAACVSASAAPVALSGGWALWNWRAALVVMGP